LWSPVSLSDVGRIFLKRWTISEIFLKKYGANQKKTTFCLQISEITPIFAIATTSSLSKNVQL